MGMHKDIKEGETVAAPDDGDLSEPCTRQQLLPVLHAGEGAELAAIVVVPGTLIKAVDCRSQGACKLDHSANGSVVFDDAI